MANQNILGQLPPDILRSFILVADTGSFTQAAKLVFRTQAAVSLQIKRLEEELGYDLFVREGRKAILSPKGEILYGYSRKILDLYDEAVAAIVQPELSGHVRIGAPDDYATQHLPSALKRFAMSHPMVQVEVLCDDTYKLDPLLNDRKLDLMITTESQSSANSIPLELVWIMSELMNPADVEVLPLALYHQECCYCHNALEALDKNSRKHRVVYRSPSLAGVTGAVKAGIAIAPVTKDTQVEGCRHAVPMDGLPEIAPVHMALRYPPGRSSKVVSSFAEFISSEMGLKREVNTTQNA
ncbi:LysR family transcriptional regulator [Maridesulfovibrio sp.]|uniref:LysR family transcriptional regulator n=1 Tax=Maridesulfovibrio sp. TaxID=2795000 RepID=UPI002A18E4E5|nr:LysR family transcriptional regulator [Maridesulfovibrio sp.]